ncbi:hypothetical protein JTB14_018037 [Gonioctena quinquepunctata]|nr:hypothetical protein JTB14_018037 [Gonioctena quinquepunctata]
MILLRKFKNLRKLAKQQIDNNTLNITNLADEIDKIQQYSRMYNLEISGMPNEKNENLISITENIISVLGCTFGKQSIDSCHRVAYFNRDNKKPRNIILKLILNGQKQEIITAIRKRKTLSSEEVNKNLSLRSEIYINDHLTFYRTRNFIDRPDNFASIFSVGPVIA